MANIPHRSGCSCLIPTATFFFFSQTVIQLLSSGPCLQHPGELERAVVLSGGPHCPSPSTFASAEHSIYFIAPLHLIALTSQIPWRVMRWLRWCQPQCWLERLTTQWGSSGEGPCNKKTGSREERGLISEESCSDFKGSSPQTPLCPIVALSLHWWACVIGLSRMGFIMKSKYREGVAKRRSKGLTWWLKMPQQRAGTVRKEVTFQFEECHAVARARKYILTLTKLLLRKQPLSAGV